MPGGLRFHSGDAGDCSKTLLQLLTLYRNGVIEEKIHSTGAAGAKKYSVKVLRQRISDGIPQNIELAMNILRYIGQDLTANRNNTKGKLLAICSSPLSWRPRAR